MLNFLFKKIYFLHTCRCWSQMFLKIDRNSVLPVFECDLVWNYLNQININSQLRDGGYNDATGLPSPSPRSKPFWQVLDLFRILSLIEDQCTSTSIMCKIVNWHGVAKQLWNILSHGKVVTWQKKVQIDNLTFGFSTNILSI